MTIPEVGQRDKSGACAGRCTQADRNHAIMQNTVLWVLYLGVAGYAVDAAGRGQE